MSFWVNLPLEQRMTDFCIRTYRYFRSHRAVYWTVMIGLYLVLGFFASRIHLEEDINKLLPTSHGDDGTTELAFANLRIKDKTFLLFEAVDNTTTPERLIEVCDDFIDSLRLAAERKYPGRETVGDVMACLSEDLTADVVDYLSEHLASYIDTAIYARVDSLLTPEHLKAQMLTNRQDLTGPIGAAYPELIQMDPLGLRTVLMDDLAPLTQAAAGSYQMVDGHFLTRDATVCVAFLTPPYASTDTGAGSALFRLLNRQIERYAQTAPDVRITYHGTPASGYYNSYRIKADMAETLLVSLVLVLAFILICFRNWDTVPLLLLPVVFGTLLGLAAMYFIKGQFSLLALGIGAIVLGVAFSYVLHVVTHYKFVSDPEQVLRDQVKPVCLGCLTTIGSFMGLIFIRTELLQDFGLFAAIAIVGTTAFSLLLLPQLLNPQKNKVNHRMFGLIDRLNAYPLERNRGLMTVLLLIIFVCIGSYLRHGILFDSNMHNLGYKAVNTTYSENLLRDKTYTGDKQKYFACSGQDMEEALEHYAILAQRLDSLQQRGIVKTFSHTDKILVPLRVQQERIDAWQAYWTDERLDLVRRLIAQTAPSAGLRPEAFEPFFDYATADYEPDALYEADLIPYGYLSTLVERSYDGQCLCFASVTCRNDEDVITADGHYEQICRTVASTPYGLVLDTYYYTRDTLIQMNEDFNILQWVSMAFVFVVLCLSFRGNMKYTLIGIMPILLSWLIVLGAMAMFGMKFNLINIIISTFIFGIGVDYSIFVMNGLIGLRERQSDRLLEQHKTAIFFSAVILIVTVGSMIFARHPAIRSVGFSTLVGMVAAVVISYVMQPAIFKWVHRK